MIIYVWQRGVPFSIISVGGAAGRVGNQEITHRQSCTNSNFGRRLTVATFINQPVGTAATASLKYSRHPIVFRHNVIYYR